MKMLKKAGALAIAGAMAMSLGTISAFADSAITLGTIEYTPATEESSIATFKVPYTAAAGVSQVTLLAELGAAEGVFADAIAYQTTAYIDQEAADTYFEFKIDDSRLQLAEDQEKLFLNVKVGGTGVSTPATASLDITPVVEDESPVTKDMVIGAVDADLGANAYESGKSLVRLDVTELIANGKLDLSKQSVKINDSIIPQYTQYDVDGATVTKLIAFVDAAAITKVEVVDGASVRAYYGDIAGSVAGAPDLEDVIAGIDMVVGNVENDDTYKLFIADVTANGGFDLEDVIATIDLVVGNTESCNAYTK